jgi:hypothetical protein
MQSGAEQKKPGETVKASYKCSGYIFNSYAMYWVRQEARKGLQYMGLIRAYTDSTGYIEGFKSQSVFSMDTSVSTSYLQISSLKVDDKVMCNSARHSVKTTS